MQILNHPVYIHPLRFHPHGLGLLLSVCLLLGTMHTPCISQTSEQPAAKPPCPEPRPVKQEEEHISINGVDYPVPPPWAGNRYHPPPLSYESFAQIPLRFSHLERKLYVHKDIIEELTRLLEDAATSGIILQVESGYRSERYQRAIFTRMFAEGRCFDDIIRYVAPPGYSQHGMGTAVDFYPSNWEFAGREEYQWLRDHAAAYGFVETYPQIVAKPDSRIPWEAWHWNYVGVEDASTQPAPAPQTQMPASLPEQP